VRFKRGQKVRCERQTPAKGNWKRYDGRKGVVKIGLHDGEVGVWLGDYDPNGNQKVVWFHPDELVPV